MKHKHRLVPGHMGGTYTEANTISLSPARCDRNVASHCMFHWANFFLYRKPEDRVAAMGLAGLLNKEEMVAELLSSNKGKVWATDGKTQKMFRPEEVPEGWERKFSVEWSPTEEWRETNKKHLDSLRSEKTQDGKTSLSVRGAIGSHLEKDEYGRSKKAVSMASPGIPVRVIEAESGRVLGDFESVKLATRVLSELKLNPGHLRKTKREGPHHKGFYIEKRDGFKLP